MDERQKRQRGKEEMSRFKQSSGKRNLMMGQSGRENWSRLSLSGTRQGGTRARASTGIEWRRDGAGRRRCCCQDGRTSEADWLGMSVADEPALSRNFLLSLDAIWKGMGPTHCSEGATGHCPRRYDTKTCPAKALPSITPYSVLSHLSSPLFPIRWLCRGLCISSSPQAPRDYY